MRTRPLTLFASVLVALVTCGVLAAPNIATADVDPSIKPDSRLKAGETFTYTSTQTMLGSGYLLYNPSQCRTHVAYSQHCDVFRVEFDRDVSPGALNFAFFELQFEQVSPPSLSVVVAGLNPTPVNDLNIYVWDEPGHYLGRNDDVDPSDASPGGNGFGSPERGGFTVKKKAYDVVVHAMSGISEGYTLRVTFSNEKFGSPFETLDDVFGPSDTPPAASAPDFVDDGSFREVLDDGVGAISVTTPLAGVNPMADAQIRNLGFGITEQFGTGIDLARGRVRDVVAVGVAPSGTALVLALIVAPLSLAGFAVWWLRRRRVALTA